MAGGKAAAPSFPDLPSLWGAGRGAGEAATSPPPRRGDSRLPGVCSCGSCHFPRGSGVAGFGLGLASGVRLLCPGTGWGPALLWREPMRGVGGGQSRKPVCGGSVPPPYTSHCEWQIQCLPQLVETKDQELT